MSLRDDDKPVRMPLRYYLIRLAWIPIVVILVLFLSSVSKQPQQYVNPIDERLFDCPLNVTRDMPLPGLCQRYDNGGWVELSGYNDEVSCKIGYIRPDNVTGEYFCEYYPTGFKMNPVYDNFLVLGDGTFVRVTNCTRVGNRTEYHKRACRAVSKEETKRVLS